MPNRTHDDGAPSGTDFGALCDRVDALEHAQRDVTAALRVVQTGHELLAGQMAELTVAQRAADVARQRLELAVAENTGITRQNNDITREVLTAMGDVRDTLQTLRDVQAAGRLGARLSRMTGAVLLKLAALITALAGAWWAWKGGGPPKP